MNMVPWVNTWLAMRHVMRHQGMENIPDGPAMFVANHLAFDDSLAIAAVYANTQNKPLRLGAKAEYFQGKGVNNRGFFGKTIQKFVVDTQQIPVFRDNDRKGSVQLAKDIKHRFAIGESVLLHAEGTRSLDGRLNRFKYGAAAFAIKNSVPLVPVSITYEEQRFSPRSIAEVTFGKPLTPVDYGMEFQHFRLLPDGLVDAVAPRMMNQTDRIVAVTNILERRIAEMSGQKRSGYYLDPHTKKLIIPDNEIVATETPEIQPDSE
ncbi:MAG: phospholipid/glycerol acyltransferase [Candidatus Saccharibacteria bacterium]|nr:phospholipid/glycerol acyltransferase [Candidatus Saccharibacteria bacterium]